ncbi:MAG: excinuclease ABC subunit UvrC, partial [Lachnospiraceae bacterium]|nr:excinuclease ABC subunit UvrC [Lachnospiraceae bacterium]
PARRKALMRQFPGLEEIKAASVEDLAAVPSMDRRSAEEVYNYLHPEG